LLEFSGTAGSVRISCWVRQSLAM